MAGIADMLIQSGLQTSQQAPDITGSIQKGAALGQHIQEIQSQRAEIDRKKQELMLQKFQTVGGWFETYTKMPEGPAKKAFAKDFIPTGIGAIGMSDKINPNVLKMMTADSNLSTFLLSEIQQGRIDVSMLNQPEAVAQYYAEHGKQFGDLEKLKGTIEIMNPQFLEAQKFALSEEGKSARAAEMAKSNQGQKGITNQNELRKELTSHPVSKDTFQIYSGYNKMLSAAKNPSAAGDLSLIFGYMKIQDPQSSVREGEQASAQNTAGVPDQIRNLYNRVTTGTRLTPEQRADFMNQAGNMYRSQFQKQEEVNGQYEQIAKANGINPKNIVAGTKFKPPPPPKVSFTPSSGQKDAFSKASPEDQKRIIDTVAKDFGLKEDEVRKLLGQ